MNSHVMAPSGAKAKIKNKHGYRNTELCPICGKKMKHAPSYLDKAWGAYIEVEYGLSCPDHGRIDYFAYGRWEGDMDDEE